MYKERWFKMKLEKFIFDINRYESFYILDTPSYDKQRIGNNDYIRFKSFIVYNDKNNNVVNFIVNIDYENTYHKIENDLFFIVNKVYYDDYNTSMIMDIFFSKRKIIIELFKELFTFMSSAKMYG